MQKELRLVNKQASQSVKEVRKQFRDRKANVQAGLLSTLAGRGAARRDVADKKRAMTREQEGVLAPYESIEAAIDQAIIQLDRTKLEIEEWLHENRS